MDRASLKKEAKQLIKGNLWTIIKPYLIIVIVIAAIFTILNFTIGIDDENPTGRILYFVMQFVVAPMYVGCALYMLKFVRNEELSTSIVFSRYSNFIFIVLTGILVVLFTTLWMLLFIIPGIIAGFRYSQVVYILAEEDVKPLEAIGRSKEMMQGHKMEYFILQLSFLGWILLIPFTLGLIYIYLGPYMATTNALYYEKLKNQPFTNNVM